MRSGLDARRRGGLGSREGAPPAQLALASGAAAPPARVAPRGAAESRLERRPGARAEDLARGVPASVVTPEAPPLLAGAIATQDIARVVHARRIVQRKHLARHRRSLRIITHRPARAGEPVGREHHIGVDKRNKLALRRGDALIRCMRESGVAPQWEHMYVGVLPPQVLERA